MTYRGLCRELVLLSKYINWMYSYWFKVWFSGALRAIGENFRLNCIVDF